jgi:exonuclease SbcC
MEETQKNLDSLTVEQEQKKGKLQLLETEKKALSEKRIILEAELLKREDIETQVFACKQDLERLEVKLSRLLELQEGLKTVESRQKELEGNQEDYTVLELAFKKSNASFLAAETLFFREQAGILALQLEEGLPCPVCGSTSHPNKAQLLSEAPSEAALQQLKQKSERSREALQKASEKLSSKRTEVRESENLVNRIAKESGWEPLLSSVDSLLDSIGKTQRENQANLKKLQEKEEEKKQFKEKRLHLDQDLEAKEKELSKMAEALQELGSSLAKLSGQLTVLHQSLSYSGIEEVNKVIEGKKHELATLNKSYKDSETAYLACKESLQSNKVLFEDQGKRLQTVKKEEAGQQEYFSSQLKAFGFSDLADYKAKLKTDSELKELKISLETYRDAVKANRQELVRLETETKDLVLQDLELLESEKSEMEEKQQQLDLLVQELSSRIAINKKVSASLAKELSEVQGFQQTYLLLSNLSKTANGELPGKQKLAFEQYVQASYFNQILTEANKRLKIMANGRFALLRKEEASNLKTQTGLEIVVMDHYTGRTRSVKSLSGGESFKASLSLALGLSDVIQSYAGGVEIDTLFIDEGFGALDAESLEMAIQTLVGLSEGNRLVGIISHVSELKERIDRQIVVSKSHRGSSIAIKV